MKPAEEAKAAVEAPSERLTGPVAKVNDAPVASADFYAEIDKITSRGAKIPADRLVRIEENILKRLVEKELIRQAIEKASLTIQEAEVDAAFDVYKKRFQTDAQFDKVFSTKVDGLTALLGAVAMLVCCLACLAAVGLRMMTARHSRARTRSRGRGRAEPAGAR